MFNKRLVVEDICVTAHVETHVSNLGKKTLSVVLVKNSLQYFILSCCLLNMSPSLSGFQSVV